MSVNFRSVSQTAGVSTAWLYSQVSLRKRIEELRTQRIRHLATPRNELASDKSKDQVISALRLRDKSPRRQESRTQSAARSGLWSAFLSEAVMEETGGCLLQPHLALLVVGPLCRRTKRSTAGLHMTFWANIMPEMAMEHHGFGCGSGTLSYFPSLRHFRQVRVVIRISRLGIRRFRILLQ